MLKVLYVIFLGVILALFIGLGIEAFYATPKNPEYPTELKYIDKSANDYNASEKAAREKYDDDFKAAQEKQANHNRNVSMIAIALSVIILALSLTVLSKIVIISDGFLLGGLLTLLYGIVRGFMSTDSITRFMLVAVGFLVVLVLGYFKFLKPNEAK